VADAPPQRRFLTPTQVAEELNVKPNQIQRADQNGLAAVNPDWRPRHVAYRPTQQRLGSGEQ
jgi:hypothetical protein